MKEDNPDIFVYQASVIFNIIKSNQRSSDVAVGDVISVSRGFRSVCS